MLHTKSEKIRREIMVKRPQNMEILHFTVPNLLRIAYTIKFYIQKKILLKKSHLHSDQFQFGETCFSFVRIENEFSFLGS